MLTKPIWCDCRKHSWTRRQFYSAWERSRALRCPDPDCQRDITLESIEEHLIEQGLVNDESSTEEAVDG